MWELVFYMRLSIITINYNNYLGLLKTINSVINQTWRGFEWIVIDGGSNDGSYELLLQYKDFFSFWCSEKDNGIYHAMNKGLSHAQGDYCLFLNSGDRFFSDIVLEKAIKSINEHDIVSFDAVIDGSNPPRYECKVNESAITAYFLMKATLPHQATFIHRELLLSLGGYDESLKIVSDWKFFIESLIFHKATFCYHSMNLVYIQPDGVSSRCEELRFKERIQVIQEFFPPLVLQDYNCVHSLKYVCSASWFCRRAYGLLFRFADWVHRLH